MTFGDLKNAIRSYLNRPGMADADVGLLVSMAQGELSRGLRKHPRSTKVTQVDQAAGDAFVPLPGDMAQLESVVSPLGQMVQFPFSGLADAQTHGNAFIALADTLEVFPTPSAPSTAFILTYISNLAPFVDDTQTDWVLTYHPDLYLYGALKEASVWLKDDARLAGWEQQFGRRLAELQSQGWNQQWQAIPGGNRRR
jgi:hypothetical protein